MPYLLGVSEDKGIHFGRWVQWARLRKGLSRDEFSQRIGVTERQLAKIEAEPEPASYERTLLAIAQGLDLSTDEMMDRWRAEPVGMPPRKFRGKKADRADQSAAARLLRGGGVGVMVTELSAAAAARGVTLNELFREVTQAWLAEHRAPRVAHAQLDGLKPRSAPAPRSTGATESPNGPVQAPRAGRRAGRPSK